MRNGFLYLLGLMVALWLGGLIALFIFVSILFKNDRATAVLAAPQMFHVFDRYQLVLAGLAIVCAIGWHVLSGARIKLVMLGFLIAATGLAVVEMTYVAPRLNGSRAVDAETFQRFHTISRWVYQGVAACVLVAGALLLRGVQQEQLIGRAGRSAAITPASNDQTSSATAQA